jgi:Xaa-Pro dipeptidase
MAEHRAEPSAERPDRSAARAATAHARISAWLDGRAARGEAARGLVLTGPAAVAWATGGIAAPVDRTAAVDLAWVVATAGGFSLITTEVEADRIRAEYGPDRHGFADLVAVPWFDPDAFVTAAQALAGVPAAELAADGHPAFGRDVTDDLIELRLALSPPEQDDLRDLAADAALALETALGHWRPGERDLDIQARCAALLEGSGADTPVLIVGGDERLARYRHPMAAGVPVRRLVMAVVVARRDGLHAAATRFASAGPIDPAYAELRGRVLDIERQVLAASAPTPGPPPATYGTVLAALDRAYEQAGAPRGWTGHYQGGPIGYGQREFEIAPGQPGTRWPDQPIAAGHALAWNPSLPGGAKVEDTYLVTADAMERVTSTSDWPLQAGDDLGRPGVLELG